jgi:phosphoglycerol geranylgeranyltransferase
MNVYEYIKNKRQSGPLHFTLLDPDKQTPEEAAEMAAKAKEYGSDAIMVGGSHAAQIEFLDECVSKIKEKVDIPIILFPSSHAGLTKHADAVFFMSLFNSRSPQYIVGEQMKGAIIVKDFELEPLPMVYLIIDSGTMTTAAYSSDVQPIPRNKPEFAVGYSLEAKYFGMNFTYLEAGSGAQESVPPEMIGAVKKTVGDMFVIVGGGIRDAETAKEKVQAGADIIVTGTVAENDMEKFKTIVQAVKNING